MGQVKINADVAGRVSALLLPVGAAVKKGEDVAVVEAMKMEIPVSSPAAGKIQAFLVAVDDVVAEGQPLVILEV